MNYGLIDTPGILDTPAAVAASSSPDLAQMLELRRFRHDDRPQLAEPRFYIQQIGISTAGNLTTISAGPKQGKSAFVGGMLAAVLSEGPEVTDCLGVASSNPDGAAVVHFDTEHSRFDHHVFVLQTLHRARRSESPDWYRSYCLTGSAPHEAYSLFTCGIEAAAREVGAIHSIFIDGVADLVGDVNNTEEAIELVTRLHGLAIQYDCPIICVIHLNPGQSNKTRGHLGSQLERKSETNLRLEQRAGATVVWSDRNRRAPIPKDAGPCFVWSNEHGMHVTHRDPSKARDDAKLAALGELAEQIFDKLNGSTAGWKAVIAAIRKVEVISHGGARKKLEALLKVGVIRKNDHGEYQRVTTPVRQEGAQ